MGEQSQKMLSVITPVFHGAPYLEACIRGVAAQNCPEVEHVIVDGGSTDGSLEILTRLAGEFSHIRWVSERDDGQSDAMNKGLSLANGSVVGFLNVDDWYEAGTLAAVLKRIPRLPQGSLLVGNCNVWNSDGSLRYCNRPRRFGFLHAISGGTFPVNPSAYFYHAALHDLVGGYRVDEHYAMDYEFLLRVSRVARIEYADELWGNFQLAPGTKTDELIRSGNIDVHLQRIRREVVSDLPPLDRVLARTVRAAVGARQRIRRSLGKVRRRLMGDRLAQRGS